MHETTSSPQIMLISHGFPPNSVGGTEQHVAALKEYLSSACEVSVVCRDARGASLQQEGAVFRLPPGQNLGSVDELAAPRDTAFEEVLAPLLDKVRPDPVHLHHWCHLSNSLVHFLKARRLPVVITLHDHYVICPGLHMLRRGEAACEAPGNCEICADCLPAPGAAFSGESLRQKTARAARQRLLGIQSLPENIHRAAADLWLARLENMRRELAAADFIISPSAALKREIASLWPDMEARITLLSHGIETAWGARVDRRPADKLRFGYAGTLSPHKGIVTLISAFKLLGAGAAQLALYGGCRDPHFLQSVTRMAQAGGVLLKGAYTQADLPALYSNIDVAVVPSLCKENAPLGVLEAFVGGAPVIASNLGGLPEPVTDGRNGLLFRAGDEGDLAAQMKRLIDSPPLLTSLRQNVTLPKSMAQYAQEISAVYNQILA